MKLKFLSGDINFKEYGAKWISKKFNNGDFDYWLVVELINMVEATGNDNQNKYNINIAAIAPSEVSEKEFKSAIDSCGWNIKDYSDTDKVLLLSEYGISACIWQQSGNNFKTLWHEVHNEIQKINILFGFYMDRTQNMIGDTGWDFIKGNIGIKGG